MSCETEGMCRCILHGCNRAIPFISYALSTVRGRGVIVDCCKVLGCAFVLGVVQLWLIPTNPVQLH